jgi:hydroxymethylbilane synthase
MGTRGSALALVQADLARAALIAAAAAAGASWEIALRILGTTGDRITNRPLSEVGGKALFTKEIDAALLAGEVDCAVHSMKDMETQLAPGLQIAAVLERADPRDCLIGAADLSPASLPVGARVGTSAVRRRAQLLACRSDLEIVPLRGNVETRLKKRESGEVDAIVLAKAGLDRLGREGVITRVLEPEEMLPAAAQGIVALVVRAGDGAVADLVRRINHLETSLVAAAERAFLAGLGGDCGTPIAAHAKIQDGLLSLEGALFSLDGLETVHGRIEGAAAEAPALGAELAARLKGEAGPCLLALLRA